MLVGTVVVNLSGYTGCNVTSDYLNITSKPYTVVLSRPLDLEAMEVSKNI